MHQDTKFFLSLTGLTTLFFVLSAYIRMIFPMPERDLQLLLGNGYVWYTMLVILNLFILSLIPFLIGIRYQVYRLNKELEPLRKDNPDSSTISIIP